MQISNALFRISNAGVRIYCKVKSAADSLALVRLEVEPLGLIGTDGERNHNKAALELTRAPTVAASGPFCVHKEFSLSLSFFARSHSR